MPFFRLLLFCFFASLITFSAAEGAVKVFTLNGPCGIVADDREWTCSIIPLPNGIKAWQTVRANDCVTGQSTKLPVKFNFFMIQYDSIQAISVGSLIYQTEEFLNAYALHSKAVLSNVFLKEKGENHVVYEGTYLDNSGIGTFAVYYLQPTKQWVYGMMIKIHSDSLDDISRANIYKQVFDLITPLYSPKPGKK